MRRQAEQEHQYQARAKTSHTCITSGHPVKDSLKNRSSKSFLVDLSGRDGAVGDKALFVLVGNDEQRDFDGFDEIVYRLPLVAEDAIA